jgi:hypothetical protein
MTLRLGMVKAGGCPRRRPRAAAARRAADGGVGRGRWGHSNYGPTTIYSICSFDTKRTERCRNGGGALYIIPLAVCSVLRTKMKTAASE